MNNTLEKLKQLNIDELISMESELKSYSQEIHKLLHNIEKGKNDNTEKAFYKIKQETNHIYPIDSFFVEDSEEECESFGLEPNLFGICHFDNLDQFNIFTKLQLEHDRISRSWNYKSFYHTWNGSGYYIITLEQDLDSCGDHLSRYDYQHIDFLSNEIKELIIKQKQDFIQKHGEYACLQKL